MTNLALIFLTGLTSGGLSCLAVQGGLLASSVAYQAEQTFQQQMAAVHIDRPLDPKRKNARQQTRMAKAAQKRFAWSIFLFLVAKLVAYTVLGFGLGWLGSMLQLTSMMRAVLQLAIGIFMVGTALRMLNVHPIFRYFVLEPPVSIRRYIRKKAKHSGEEVAAPLVLGALTVFIPCGVTQVMMASAVGSGNPTVGAAIMFSFTLGTSPVFFTFAYLAMRLGEKLEARFLQLIALAVFLLGVVSINGGLNLLGSPYSLTSLKTSLLSAPDTQPQLPVGPLLIPTATTAPSQATPVTTEVGEPTISVEAAIATLNAPSSSWNSASPTSQPGSKPSIESGPGLEAAANVITIQVLDSGYDPNYILAQPEQPLQLNLVTNHSYSCGRAFLIPALDIQTILPETGETAIDISPQPAGSVLYFTCAMGMFSGQIRF
jgi:uncharacterized protein